MKTIFFTVIIYFSLSLISFAQVSTEWIQRYNGIANNSDIPVDITTDKKGNIYITGHSVSSSSGEDILTIKLSSTGILLWTKSYTGPGGNADRPVKIFIDKEENIFILGTSVGQESSFDVLLIKYNQEGEQLWVMKYNGTDNKNDQPTSVVTDADGFLYIAGYTITEETTYDYLTLKVSPDGQIIWAKTFNGRGDNSDQATGIALDRDGNIFVTGFSIGNNTGYDYVTIKYKNNGDSVWIRSYNGTGNSNDQAFGIVVNDEGEVFTTGTSWGNNQTNDIATVKYSNSGVQQWAVRYNGPDNKTDQVHSIMLDLFGNLYITGFSAGASTNNDFITIKYNQQGVELWNTRYNGLGNSIDQPLSMYLDNMGCVYVTGYSWNGLDNDFLTVKYSSLGNELWVASYNGLGNGIDQANSITVDESGYVFVAGNSIGSGTLFDYAVLKYKQEKPSTTPNLIAPANNAIGIQPEAFFDWTDLPTSDAYHVQIAYEEGFNNIILDTVIYMVSQFTINEGYLQNNSKYYWRVNPNNAAGAGAWSQIWSFSVLTVPDIPLLVSPVNGARESNTGCTLKWKEIQTAASYRLQISKEYNFSNPVIDLDGLKDAEYTLPSDKIGNNAVYFWRVNASNIAGTVPWSEIWSIGIGNVSAPTQPVLISLPNGSVGQSLTPILDWNDVPSAQNYRIQISSDLNFQSTAFDQDYIIASHIQIPAGKLFNNTLYYWKVSAQNIGGVSNWSLIWTFTTMITGLQKIGKEIPKEVKLYNNYPEPFASTTQIKFDIPQSINNKNVSVIIFDLLGKEIAKLVNENLKAGTYIVNWDASNYARGYYLYQLRTEGLVETRRMLLVK